MLETIVAAVFTLVAVGLGFYLGRLPVDKNLPIPKSKTKPQPATVSNHRGKIEPVNKEENPLLSFKEP